MKRNCKKLVSVFLVLLLTVSMVFGTKTSNVMAGSLNQSDLKTLVKQALAKKIAADSSGIKGKLASSDKNKLLSKGNPGDIVRVIVQLKDKPSIEKGAKSTSSVKASQQSIIQQVKSLKGASIKKSFGYLVNGFSMNVMRSEISKIEAISGVKSVTEAQAYTPDMNFAKNLTQAYSTWKDLGYKGEGMVIAIVDTGIDYTHKDMVITDTSKEKLHSSDITSMGGKGKFFTDKVPYGYNFADNNQNVIDANTSEQHGMHVSGIVAANGNKDEVSSLKAVQGEAPEAQLLAMKVFSNTPGNMEYCYDDDVIAAIEDSVAHKADVINMSLGSATGFTDPDSPEQEVIKNATDNGTLVVISAGNAAISSTDDGWANPQTNLINAVDTETVGEPGTAQDSLCVASYENSDLTVSIMDYTAGSDTGTVAYATAMGDPEKLFSTPTSIVDCGIGEDDETKNDFEGKDLTGKIALIKRGSLNFSTKVENAQNHNAAGVIIYDKDLSQGGSNDPLTGMSLDGVSNATVIGIGNASGNKYVDLLKNGDVKVAFTGKMGSVPSSTANEISPYTSWGPTPSLDFKPEITAPGGDIYSTQNNNKYTTMSGTSMAAPNVSGSEALILQAAKKNLGLTGRDLITYAKNTAINTAKVELDPNTDQVPYSPREQGSGMIQIENAIKNNVIVTDDNGNAAVSLKEIGSTKTFSLNLKNYGSTAVTYTLGDSGVLGEKVTDDYGHFADYVVSGSGIAFSSNTVTVPAKGQAKVTVTVTIPSSFTTEQFAEGFIKLTSSDSAVPSLSVPFIGFYGNWSKPDILDKPLYDNDSLIGGESLTDGNNYLGICKDSNGLYVNPDDIAFSTSEESITTSVVPALSFLRNAKTMTVDVVDNNNGKENVLRTIANDNKLRKDLLDYTAGSGGVSLYSDCAWDGKLYDKTTGKYISAPDGQYYLRFTTKVDLPDAVPQTLYMPVKVDSQAPVFEIQSETVSDDNSQCTVTWKASDNDGGSGVNPLNMLVVLNNGLTDTSIKYDDTTKEYSTTVNLDKDVPNDIIIAGTDYAGNLTMTDTMANSAVVFDNLFDNIELPTEALNTAGKYEVTGRVNSGVGKLTINGADAQIDSNSTFEADIALNEGSNTVSVAAFDKDGKALSTKSSYTVSLLTKAPVITIESPSSNPYSVTDVDTVKVSGTIKFEANSGANNISVTNSLGSDIHVQYEPDTGKFSADVPVNGFTTILVDAQDGAGNSSEQSLAVVATLNNEPFSINFDDLTSLSALPAEAVKDDTLSITGSVNHRPKTFQINGVDIDVNDDLTFSQDFKLQQGKNKFVVYAVDKDDSVVYNYTYTVEYDSVKPQVTITDPIVQADGKIYTNKDTVELKGSVMDNTYGYTLSINGDNILSSDKYPEKGQANTKNFDYSVPVKDGSIITIEVTDEFGNKMTEQIPVVVDKTAPNKPVVSLSTTAATTNPVTVTIAADSSDKDVTKLEYSFDNSTWLAYSAPVVVNTNRTVYARATDKSGNVSQIASLSITNIQKPVTPSPSTPSKPSSVLPKTGSMVNFDSLMGLGGVLVMLGAVIALFRRKKETDEKNC